MREIWEWRRRGVSERTERESRLLFVLCFALLRVSFSFAFFRLIFVLYLMLALSLSDETTTFPYRWNDGERERVDLRELERERSRLQIETTPLLRLHRSSSASRLLRRVQSTCFDGGTCIADEERGKRGEQSIATRLASSDRVDDVRK